jgi:hypothetical protein
MLYKSYIYFSGRVGSTLGGRGRARLTFGDHPRMRALRELGVGADPVFTAYFPSTHGVLDDHFECWFLSYDALPAQQTEGMESVVNLGLGETWLAPPRRDSAATLPR